jgi:hypothetical protein
MRFVISKPVNSYDLGLYATNSIYPIGHNWEVGMHLIFFDIGIKYK